MEKGGGGGGDRSRCRRRSQEKAEEEERRRQEEAQDRLQFSRCNETDGVWWSHVPSVSPSHDSPLLAVLFDVTTCVSA